jgi:thymidylate synthase ThyX
MITARILLDSIAPNGKRLTTWVLTYPRFIHAEFMTHRVFSRNASSSRAIPVKKMLDDVKNNPAVPVYWGKNQSGMQAAEELDDTTSITLWEANGPYPEPYTTTARAAAQREWLKARNSAIFHVEKMVELGLHKQIANRLLEPWMHITVLATTTEHENFFSLRAHKDAQPEFQQLAYIMLDEYQKSVPNKLEVGQWHIPFGDKFEEVRLVSLNNSNYDVESPDWHKGMTELRLKIATARCARVSYLNFDGKDDYSADVALADRLASSGHWSPFEHCAQAMETATVSGNFIGWKQYRKFFSQENRTDPRIK